MTEQSLEVQLARLDMRVELLERQQDELNDEIKKATKEIAEVTLELKLLAQELRGTIAAAVQSATKPFDRLSWGWRVLAGLGTFTLGVVALVGGVVGIADHFLKH